MKFRNGLALLLLTRLLICGPDAHAIPCLPELGFFSKFGLEANGLYWRTCRDNRDFAVTETTSPTDVQNFVSVLPKNHWGWRVKGYFQNDICSSFFADLEYTHFTANEAETANNPALFTFFQPGPLSQLNASVKDWHRRLRGRAGYFIDRNKIGDFYVFGGLDWIYLKERNMMQGILVAGPQLSMKQVGKFNGAALEAGMGMIVNLFDCLAINGEIAALGILGPRSYELKFTTPAEPPFDAFFIHYPKTTLCLPGIDLRIEALYRQCWLVPLTFTVGYEHHQFFNMMLLSAFYDVNAYANPTMNDRGFGGIYFGVRCNY